MWERGNEKEWDSEYEKLALYELMYVSFGLKVLVEPLLGISCSCVFVCILACVRVSDCKCVFLLRLYTELIVCFHVCMCGILIWTNLCARVCVYVKLNRIHDDDNVDHHDDDDDDGITPSLHNHNWILNEMKDLFLLLLLLLLFLSCLFSLYKKLVFTERDIFDSLAWLGLTWFRPLLQLLALAKFPYKIEINVCAHLDFRFE